MPLGLTVSQHTGMVCLLKKVKVPLQLPFCRTIREELKLNLCLRKDAGLLRSAHLKGGYRQGL